MLFSIIVLILIMNYSVIALKNISKGEKIE
jgi:hypothetical protein